MARRSFSLAEAMESVTHSESEDREKSSSMDEGTCTSEDDSISDDVYQPFPDSSSSGGEEDTTESEEEAEHLMETQEAGAETEEPVAGWRSRSGKILWLPNAEDTLRYYPVPTGTTPEDTLHYYPVPTGTTPGPTLYAVSRISSVMSTFELLRDPSAAVHPHQPAQEAEELEVELCG